MILPVKKICLSLMVLMLPLSVSAQTAFWKSVRQGNRAFRSGDFDKAEKTYHQALSKDTANPYILYNLGNVNLSKTNTEDAQKYLKRAAKSATQSSLPNSRLLRAYANHNLGVINQMQVAKEKDKKQELLQQAIEHYKEALRNNPSDDETRYNLALCQYQLKKEQQNQQNQQNQQQDQQNKDENKEQNKDKKDQNKDQQQNQNEQKNNPEKQPIDPQTQQMMNLSRQEEQKTRDKLNKVPRGRTSLEKNW